MEKHKKSNFLKEKMKGNKPIIGTWSTINSTMLVETLASSGLDFVIIDYEHGPFEIGKTSDYVNACTAYGCSPIIRIPKNSDWMSLQVLDQGAHGIVIPGVKDLKTVDTFIDKIKYAPTGRRGFSPYTKSGGFSNRDLNYKENANDSCLSIVIIENVEGINNIDSILENPSVDIIYFGAYDLSQDLGITGDVYNKKLLSTVEPAIKKVLNANKYAGGFVPQNFDEIKLLFRLGINFITFDVDSHIINSRLNKIVNQFDKYLND